MCWTVTGVFCYPACSGLRLKFPVVISKVICRKIYGPLHSMLLLRTDSLSSVHLQESSRRVFLCFLCEFAVEISTAPSAVPACRGLTRGAALLQEDVEVEEEAADLARSAAGRLKNKLANDGNSQGTRLPCVGQSKVVVSSERALDKQRVSLRASALLFNLRASNPSLPPTG